MLALSTFLGRPTYCPAVKKCPVDTFRQKKTSCIRRRFLCSRYLSSRAVARQVLSAYMSLTSVFGMGTGGPSWQSTRTHYGWLLTTFYIKSQLASNSIRIIALRCALVNICFTNAGNYIPWKLNIVISSAIKIWLFYSLSLRFGQAFGLLVSVS